MGKVMKGVTNVLFGKERTPPQLNLSKDLARSPNFVEPKLNLSAPPSPSDIDDVLDYIAGVKAITVTDSSGKKTQELRRLPRTPEEEQFFRNIPNLLNTTFQNLQSLYQYDPTQVVDFMPLISSFANVNQQRLENISQIADLGNIKQDIQNFQNMQNTLIDEEFKNINRSLDEDLAHRGLSNSTYAAEAKAALGKQQALARQEGSIRASTYGENLADQRFARNRNVYDVNEEGRQGVLNQAQLDFELQQQQLQNLNAQRQTAISNNMSGLDLANNIRNQDLTMAANSPAASMQAQNYLNRLNVNQAGNENQLAAYNAKLAAYGQQMGNYQTNVNTQLGQYDRQLNAFKAQGPSNQAKFMTLVGGLAGHKLGGPDFGKLMMSGLGGHKNA